MTADAAAVVDAFKTYSERCTELAAVMTEVVGTLNRALTHLALSAHERPDFLKDFDSRSVNARREVPLTQFDSRTCNDDEHRSLRDVQAPVPQIRKEIGQVIQLIPLQNEFPITSLSKPSTLPARRIRNKPLKP